MKRRPDELTNFGEARLFAETARFDLPTFEIASPRRGDRIQLDGETFVIQGEPTRDRARLVWTVDTRPE